MKHFLLLGAFLFAGAFAYSQNSYSEWLKPQATIKKIDISVFPNPVTENFSISENEAVEKIIVYNMLGRPLKRFSYLEGKKYKISDLSRGVYLVQMVNEKNKILSTKRITKR